MDALVSAIATLRSYGGRVMIVVQTIASLDVYGKEGAAVILANCRMQLFMAPADKDTPTYISSAIGNFTRKSRSKSWKGGELTTSYQEREDGAPLIRPEQLRMLSEDLVVALVQNSNPILVNKVFYDQDRVLKPLFEGQVGPYPDPPKLPDDPVAAPKEPIVPKPMQGGAENLITTHRPAEEVPAPAAVPVAAEIGDGAETADGKPIVVEAEANEEQAVFSVRDRWRHMGAAVAAAEKMYRPDAGGADDSAEQTVEATAEGDDGTETGSEAKNGADAKVEDDGGAVTLTALKKASLAEAQATHRCNSGEPESPSED